MKNYFFMKKTELPLKKSFILVVRAVRQIRQGDNRRERTKKVITKKLAKKYRK